MTDDWDLGANDPDEDSVDPNRIPDEPERISDDPGRPDDIILGAPGSMLVIISGPSGVGKDTIIDVMREQEARTDRTGERHYVVTVTTRAPRNGEVDGVDYHFVTREEFLRIRAGSSRRTRSTATGTARRATRSGRRWPTAATPSSRSMSRARRSSRSRSPRPC